MFLLRIAIFPKRAKLILLCHFHSLNVIKQMSSIDWLLLVVVYAMPPNANQRYSVVIGLLLSFILTWMSFMCRWSDKETFCCLKITSRSGGDGELSTQSLHFPENRRRSHQSSIRRATFEQTPQIIWEYDLQLLDHRKITTNRPLIPPEHLLHLMLCYHSSKINTKKAILGWKKPKKHEIEKERIILCNKYWLS